MRHGINMSIQKKTLGNIAVLQTDQLKIIERRKIGSKLNANEAANKIN